VRFFRRATTTQALLDRSDCTLEALLAEDELIQELKSLNSRVINLCARPRQQSAGFGAARPRATAGRQGAAEARGGISCAAVSPQTLRVARAPHASHGAAAARRGGGGGGATPAGRRSAVAVRLFPRSCLD
jgi:hypothetical protein